ncbi:multidrug resistance protein mrp-7-like isoform X2 [Haemaphysalis longicornis]
MDYTLLDTSRLESQASCLLKWTFIGASLLSAIELTQTVQRQSSSRRRTVCVTLCDIVYILCNLLTAATYLAPKTASLTAGGLSSTDVAAVVAVGWITLSVICQRWRGFCVSNLPPLLHACFFVATLTDVLLWMEGLATHRMNNHGHQNKEKFNATMHLLVAFAACGSFLCACFRSGPVLGRAASQVRMFCVPLVELTALEKQSPKKIVRTIDTVNTAADEESFTPFGIMAGLSAIRHILNVARLSKLVENDIRPTIRRVKCRLMISRLYKPLKKNWTGPRAGTRVLWAFLRVLWREVFWVLLTGSAYFTTLLLRAPLLEALIENGGNWEGTTVTMLFVAACTAEVWFSGFVDYVARRLSVQLKFLTQAAVFSKMTRMSASALSEATAGYLVSVVAVDVDKLNIAVSVCARDSCGILCLPLLLWMLTKRVGTLPVAGCVGWQLACLILYVAASKLQAALWKRINHYRDSRLRKMADTLSCVRLVKLYAWEDAVNEAVHTYRKKENYLVFLTNLLDGFIDSLQNSSTTAITVILFGTLVSVNGMVELTPARSFPSLYMLSIVEAMFVNLAVSLRCWSMAWQGVKRLAKALTAEERNPDIKTAGCAKYKAGTVLLKKCEFAWIGQNRRKEKIAEGEIALSNINLRMEPGALIGVVGLVGSGKSALLEAILGDLRCTGGTVHISGRMAYVPQEACIFSMSLRDNVLFGKSMQTLRYNQVLEACELTSDLAMFPAGDLTEVGEKGETLSGGQKQRVALARAVYSDSDIYLLDDTLSALDVHVSAKVFAQVIGPKGLLRNKTRIVVSNQGIFLARMDKLLLLWEKSAIPFDSFYELTADSRAPKTLLLGSKPQSSAAKNRESGYASYDVDEGMTVGKLTNDEVRDINLGTVELLRSLATLCGPCLPLAILCLTARAATIGFFLYCIKLWTDTTAFSDNDGQTAADWIVILGILCLCDLVLCSAGGILLAVAIRRLSMRLHNAMLQRLLSCAMAFFEATPRGRILNRFSTDLDMVDTLLCLDVKQGIQMVTVTFARLAVVGTQASMACVSGVIAMIVYLVVVTLSVRTANAFRSLESARFSRVLQHLTETRDSISTVRCFGAVALFNKRFYRLVDDVVRTYWAMIACVRLTRVCGAVAGLCAILATLATLALSNHPTSKSGVGLALSSAMSDDCCKDETKNSDPPATPRTSPMRTIQNTWPAQGKLVFDNFTASYKPGVLPPVLDNLSFVIKSNEKVGVVGRTGAGKSSLILALMRVLKPSSGRIVIDNVDISSLPLRKLRSTITVIPQEPYLMKGSLRENLDGLRCHSDEEVWEALRKAHMADFVSNQADGLLMVIEDGAENLSAGQRQLLCLARALLRAPRVLLLDEATSRLDGDTDRLIQQTLKEGFAASTVLTVAHRLHTVLHCDRILVMADGRIAELGSVGELAANPTSIFAAMARAAGIDISTLTNNDFHVHL